MLLKTIAAGAALLCLGACGTMAFVPTEYPLRDGLIAARPVVGKVTFNNAQTSTEQTIVYDYSLKLATTLKDVTQVMVDQAAKELGKATQAQPGDKAKTIDLKITYIKSTYIAFFWKSELRYTAVLGGATTLEKTVNHSTGANPQQDLNGAVADAVVDLMSDPKVIAYLAQ